MKLLFHGTGHHKVLQSIVMMCKAKNIECEITNDDSRIRIFDYNILILNRKYFDPTLLPIHIKVIYGPQFWVFPEGPLVGPYELQFEKRCVYNTLSKWVEELYVEIANSLRIPMVQFPYAIDIERFCPLPDEEKTLDCVVYIKRRSKTIVNTVLSYLTSNKLIFKVYSYGSYSEASYLKDLRTAKYMIVLDAHESQGYALQEAMSCGVPLLVLDATSMYDEVENEHPNYAVHVPKKLYATTVPYWSTRCGIKIKTVDEFEKTNTFMLEHYKSFSPREFIIETLSPIMCMERILEYFDLKITYTSS